jgi:c-di-AMP phosphodiesterase-like protein
MKMSIDDEINYYPFACAVTDNNGDIIATNNLFEENIAGKGDKKTNIADVAEGLGISVGKVQTEIGGCVYEVAVCPYADNRYKVMFIKLRDSDEPVMLGVVLVDNYIEVQESIEESRHPHLVAVIDRKINEYFTNLGGVVRKYESDKYLLILPVSKLDTLKENKFDIMEMLAKIDLGNIPVTLSIGIGFNGDTINKSMEYARGALDLALGRGGNQVVIKESDEQYTFIGGDGTEVAQNSRVKARVKASGLIELIISASDVMLMGHKNPDLDSLGSSAGVFAIASFFGKPCHIVLNKVTPSVSSLYNRLLEDNKYKDAFIDGDTALKTIRKKTLLIVLDTCRQSMCECSELIDKAVKLVVFDHHRKSKEHIENYALTYHDPGASSTSELVTEMMMYMGKGIKLTKTEAEGLLAGITVDTKNFAFKTGVKTFEASAYLKRNGADTISVRRLFRSSFEDYSAKADVVKNAKMIHENMAVSVLTQPVDNPTVLIAQAADEMLGINGIEVSYVLCEIDGNVSISARSLGTVNVQKLMEKLGGGGHQTGAAAQLSGMSIDSAIELLEEKIDEYLEELQ